MYLIPTKGKDSKLMSKDCFGAVFLILDATGHCKISAISFCPKMKKPAGNDVCQQVFENCL